MNENTTEDLDKQIRQAKVILKMPSEDFWVFALYREEGEDYDEEVIDFTHLFITDDSFAELAIKNQKDSPSEDIRKNIEYKNLCKEVEQRILIFNLPYFGNKEICAMRKMMGWDLMDTKLQRYERIIEMSPAEFEHWLQWIFRKNQYYRKKGWDDDGDYSFINISVDSEDSTNEKKVEPGSRKDEPMKIIEVVRLKEAIDKRIESLTEEILKKISN